MQFEEFHSGTALASAAAPGHLSEREKQMIGLAVVATRGCIACTGGRIQQALASGIPREAVIQAIDVAASVNAGVTIAIALQGAERVGVDAVCADPVCTSPACG